MIKFFNCNFLNHLKLHLSFCMLFVFLTYFFVSEGQARGPLSSIFGLWSKRFISPMSIQIQRIDKGLQEISNENNYFFFHPQRSDSNNINWAFYLQKIRLRIRPRVTFQIPGLAQLRIAPFVELEYIKNRPAGWSDYKPR